MTKKIFGYLSLILVVALLAACEPAPDDPAEPPDNGEPVQFSFWAAPNPPQEVFWREMADLYMQENTHITIEVSPMPEAPTSEAGILAAIAGGTAPTASENVFTGFGGELLRGQAIVPLNELQGWNDLIEARNMQQTIDGWQFEGDQVYIFPIYSNAMVFGWRTDFLAELGYQEPPRDYAGVVEMGQQLKQQDPNRFVWARPALTSPTWWERWFDFFILYYAASGGQPLITGNQVTADEGAAVNVLTFLQDMAQNNLILTQEELNPFETGTSVMTELGPWTFPAWEEQFPELQLDQNFTLTMPPAPAGTPEDQVMTFADAKGVVIYAQATEAQRQAAWDFISWVFSDPQHDLQWLERTNLPPARDDLATNEAFQAFFAENPELVIYAENIPNAVPPLNHPEFTEIQRMLGEEAVNPVVRLQKEPQQAWNDWVNAIQPLLGE